MFSRWERRFLSLKENAAREFEQLETAAGDDRIYHIHSREQLMERCRSMLFRAKRIVVADLFPKVLQEIRDHIEGAAARGVEARLKVYEPIEIAHAANIVDARGSRIRDDRPYEWLGLVVDGAELVLANLAADGEDVFRAVWSESPYLAWVYHCGIESEIIVDSYPMGILRLYCRISLLKAVCEQCEAALIPIYCYLRSKSCSWRRPG